MSVVTTQSEMLTPVPSPSEVWLPSGGPDEGARLDGGRLIERRRQGSPDDSPMDILTRLPALVVLERLPVPSLAMTREGIIVFANTAFANMVGYRQDALAGLTFPDVFRTVPAAVFGLFDVDALSNLVVELKHCDGWTVRARVSKSAMMRRDDQFVLVTFQDMTELLWMDER